MQILGKRTFYFGIFNLPFAFCNSFSPIFQRAKILPSREPLKKGFDEKEKSDYSFLVSRGDEPRA
jgi:hypothetical protein